MRYYTLVDNVVFHQGFRINSINPSVLQLFLLILIMGLHV